MEKRGNISLWFSECSIRQWFSRKESKEVGRPFIYSDEAIKTFLKSRFGIHDVFYDAASSGFYKLVGDLLRDKRVQPNKKIYGETPLIAACRGSNVYTNLLVRKSLKNNYF